MNTSRSAPLLLFFALLLPSSPSRADQKLHVPRVERRLLLKTLFCARDLVQHSTRSIPGKFLALDFLSRAHAVVGQTSSQTQIVAECHRTLKDLRSGELERLDPDYVQLRERYADWISVPEHADIPGVPDGVQNLVEDFQLDGFGHSWAECTMLGPEAIIGLGIAVSAGVHAGICVQRDWRRWIAIGGQVGFGAGIGAAVGAHVEDETLRGATGGDYELAEGSFRGIGAIDAMEWSDEGSDYTYGVGLGRFIVARAAGHIKVIPIGTHRRKILAEFMSEELSNEYSGPHPRD